MEESSVNQIKLPPRKASDEIQHREEMLKRECEVAVRFRVRGYLDDTLEALAHKLVVDFTPPMCISANAIILTDSAVANRMKAVHELAESAASVARQEAISILADTERALKRAAKRAEELDGEWERVEFVPTRGATVEMTARLIGEDTFETRGREPLSIQMQVWETKAGALVAVDETVPLYEGATAKLAVKVCPPTADAQEQRFAVMEHFGWSSRARSMARKLGWSLRVEIP
jgi:hypothetical protein